MNPGAAVPASSSARIYSGRSQRNRRRHIHQAVPLPSTPAISEGKPATPLKRPLPETWSPVSLHDKSPLDWKAHEQITAILDEPQRKKPMINRYEESSTGSATMKSSESPPHQDTDYTYVLPPLPPLSPFTSFGDESTQHNKVSLAVRVDRLISKVEGMSRLVKNLTQTELQRHPPSPTLTIDDI